MTMFLPPVTKSEMKMAIFNESAVKVEVAHNISGPQAAAIHSKVQAARATLDGELRAEINGVIEKLPERVELQRLQALLEKAQADAAKIVGDRAALDGEIVSKVAGGQSPPAKLWDAQRENQVKQDQQAQVVSALQEGVLLAQDKFEHAAQAAVIAWQQAAFEDAQKAADAELAPIVKALEKHIAAWLTAKNRADAIRCMKRGEWRDPPAPEPVDNRWDYRRRLGLMPNVKLTPSIPADAKLSDFGVEMLPPE